MNPEQIAEIASANAEKARAALNAIDPSSIQAKILLPLVQAVESNSDLIAALAKGMTGFKGPEIPLGSDRPPVTEADAKADRDGEHRPDNPTTPEGIAAKEALEASGGRSAIGLDEMRMGGSESFKQGHPRLSDEDRATLTPEQAAAHDRGYDEAKAAASDGGEPVLDAAGRARLAKAEDRRQSGRNAKKAGAPRTAPTDFDDKDDVTLWYEGYDETVDASEDAPATSDTAGGDTNPSSTETPTA